MAKTSKAVRREGAHLWRYLMEVREVWRSILGAAAVIALLAVVRWSLSAALPAIIPHLPVVIVPWLSWHRLTVAAVVLLVFLAQYLAWRKQYLANHSEGPEIDDRLELLEEAPGPTAPDDRISRDLREALSLALFPDHELSLILRARTEIQPALTIECRAPIYRAFALYWVAGEEGPIQVEPVRRLQEGVFFRFGDRTLPAESRFLIKVFSPVPVALKRARVTP